MTLLLMPSPQTTRKPETRPRVWYQALFKYMSPAKARLTPEQALSIIEENWERPYRDIKQNGFNFEDK